MASYLDRDIQRLRKALPPLPAPRARGIVVMLCGLPGAGKSTFAHLLAQRTDILVLESDALRLALFGHPTYSATESARLFQAVHALLGELLARRLPLVFDATNLREAYRQAVYRAAAAANATVIPVWVEAPEPLIRQRFARRDRQREATDRSEATWQVYLRYKKDMEPILGLHIVVDTSRDLGPAVERVLAALPQP